MFFMHFYTAGPILTKFGMMAEDLSGVFLDPWKRAQGWVQANIPILLPLYEMHWGRENNGIMTAVGLC
jgi:hypothetical protein